MGAEETDYSFGRESRQRAIPQLLRLEDGVFLPLIRRESIARMGTLLKARMMPSPELKTLFWPP